MGIKIGIIAEGKADQVVLRNILYAFDFDKKDIRLLRPELDEDLNDAINKTASTEREFGSWTNVQDDCKSRIPFVDFFDNPLAEQKFIIVHLDTDTCAEYGVAEFFNPKTTTDFTVFRQRVIDKINEWLDNQYIEHLLYAICIRQTDAWILTLFAKQGDKDTAKISNPKRELQNKEDYKNLNGRNATVKYDLLSEKFSNKKKLKNALSYNQSLADFVNSILTIL
jgi:hypothetical protein